MDLSELWVFPVPSNCIYSGVSIIYEGGNLILLFDYYDENNNDKIFNAGILFETTTILDTGDVSFLSTR